MTRKPIPNRDRFDFDGFINSIIDLDFISMSQAVTREYRRVEASMSGRGGPQARADGGFGYVARLKRVGFWFHNGNMPPDGANETAACRRIAEKLVAKGQLKPEIFEAFNLSQT